MTTPPTLYTRADLALAAELIVTSQFGSPSMVQRKARLGYAVVAAMFEELCRLGVIEHPRDGGPYAVLVRPERCEQAVSAVRAGVRVDGVVEVDTQRYSAACGVVYHALPEYVPDAEACHLTVRIVNALIAAGWRPAGR